jgi:hypothetical protein
VDLSSSNTGTHNTLSFTRALHFGGHIGGHRTLCDLTNYLTPPVRIALGNARCRLVIRRAKE